MNFILISDILWYSGHILTGCSIIYTHSNYPLAISFVFIGQFITIISRPISRIQKTKIDVDENKIHNNNDIESK